MSEFAPRVTSGRVVAGIAILLVATAILWFSGVGMRGFFTGLAIGLAVFGSAAALWMWTQRKSHGSPGS
jgi:hypothetical protein